MQPAEAIGILRGDVSPSSVLHRGIADGMGADALEAWEVVAREGQPPRMTMDGAWRFVFQQSDGVVIAGDGATPLAAVLDAMEKEGKG